MADLFSQLLWSSPSQPICALPTVRPGGLQKALNLDSRVVPQHLDVSGHFSRNVPRLGSQVATGRPGPPMAPPRGCRSAGCPCPALSLWPVGLRERGVPRSPSLLVGRLVGFSAKGDFDFSPFSVSCCQWSPAVLGAGEELGDEPRTSCLLRTRSAMAPPPPRAPAVLSERAVTCPGLPWTCQGGPWSPPRRHFRRPPPLSSRQAHRGCSHPGKRPVGCTV